MDSISVTMLEKTLKLEAKVTVRADLFREKSVFRKRAWEYQAGDSGPFPEELKPEC